MKNPIHYLDKQKLLGFRLLNADKSRPDRLLDDKQVIGAKVGINGKGGGNGN